MRAPRQIKGISLNLKCQLWLLFTHLHYPLSTCSRELGEWQEAIVEETELTEALVFDGNKCYDFYISFFLWHDTNFHAIIPITNQKAQRLSANHRTKLQTTPVAKAAGTANAEKTNLVRMLPSLNMLK